MYVHHKLECGNALRGYMNCRRYCSALPKDIERFRGVAVAADGNIWSTRFLVSCRICIFQSPFAILFSALHTHTDSIARGDLLSCAQHNENKRHDLIVE